MMCLFRAHSLRDETQPFPRSEDMGIHWESFSSHAKKKETVNGFGADPFQAPHGSLDFFRIHLSQKGKAHSSFAMFNPTEGLPDTPCFLFRQSPRSDGLNNSSRPCSEDIFPLWELGL